MDLELEQLELELGLEKAVVLGSEAVVALFVKVLGYFIFCSSVLSKG